MTAVCERALCSLVEAVRRIRLIALMMDAIRTSETSVYFN
jgi:hypothetical protein